MRNKPKASRSGPPRLVLPVLPVLLGALVLGVVGAAAGLGARSGLGGVALTASTTPTSSTGATTSSTASTTTTTSLTTTSSTGTTDTASTAAANTPGYWLVGSDGGIFSFGVPFYGSMGGKPLNKPIVGMAATPDGHGYWEVAADGGIFSFGDAAFHGSMGGKPLNEPVVGMAADPNTGGYWEVAADGGIFSFDAPFYGSMGGKPLNKPIVAMAATPDGQGYWLVASDGGIFTFGDATFEGSLGGDVLVRPVVTITTADANGYWMTDTNGAVTSFGDAPYSGSAPQHLNAPVVGMAEAVSTVPTANFAFPSGAYGYDVSKYQENSTCTATLPSGHTIGVVEVTGAAKAAPNPCLAQEATWAGAGLGLYIFMNQGTSTTDQPGCESDQWCNWGYEAATYALSYATAQGVHTGVTWWLDVEGASLYWSSDTAHNDQVIAGAITALRSAGINNVGIYTSPLSWSKIAGTYQPAVPLWIAWYTGDPQSNCANARSFAAANGDTLPTGPVVLTQYTDNNGNLDGDYAC